MKHKIAITLLVMFMFLLTQFIGLFVINHYSDPQNPLPYGMGVPTVESQSSYYSTLLPSIVFAFIFAIVIFFLLTRFNLAIVMRLWFFFVVMIALGISLNAFFPGIPYFPLIALIFVLPLALSKTFKRNILVHNITELFIYPGIAAIFVSLLNFWTMAILVLILIPLYDMWAVWRSGIMQKMAKYQINEVKVFGGFFITYISREMRMKLKKLPKDKLKNKKIKAEVAILGGGDIVFSMIAAGVMMRTFTASSGLTAGVLAGIFTIFGAFLGLSYLLFAAKKKKFYPAMPFISSGILLGIIASWIFL